MHFRAGKIASPPGKENDAKPTSTTTDSAPEDSPIKTEIAKTKRRRISSSSEEEVQKKKVIETPPIKKERSNDKAVRPKTSPEVNTEIKKIGSPEKKISPKKESPPKIKEESLESNKEAEIKKEKSEDKPKPVNPFERTVKIQNAGQGLSGADYDPSKKNYHPIKDAFWKRGEK